MNNLNIIKVSANNITGSLNIKQQKNLYKVFLSSKNNPKIK